MSQEFKINKHPTVVFDKSVQKSSLKYRIDVDATKAGDLLRYLGVDDEVITKSKIVITNRMFRHKLGSYNHGSKAMNIRASRGMEIYEHFYPGRFRGWLYRLSEDTALKNANLSLNDTFLHEAYHLYDFHNNHIDHVEHTQEYMKNTRNGCLFGLVGAAVVGSTVQVLETLGLRTDVACIDTGAVITAGGLALICCTNRVTAKFYRDDPIEVAARNFAIEHRDDSRWNSIVRFSLTK
ncbi:MAG: hypothetical protein WCV81_03095 [Microgenomates group bacterium]|jgi:hypothetical protein